MKRHGSLALLALMAAGCASPGPPRPPSLQLPMAARDLRAQRVGPTVVLDWTIPNNTTDGDTLRGAITSVLCRKLAAGPCVPVGSYTHIPGPQHVTDTLPAPLLAGAPALLEYRIDLLNDHHRSAGTPASVFTAAGSAPPAVTAFAIAPRPGGALITWAATSSAATMQVERTPVNQPAKPAAAPAPVARKTRAPALPGTSHKGPQGQLVLVATGGAAVDPGGLLDTTARPAEPYMYVAQRVQTLKLAGKSIEIRSLPSPATAFTYVDSFPPASPTGLVSIPGGGFGVPPSIDLSWDPVPDRDVAGYNIYRADPSGQFRRLNPRLVPAPAYRDLTVQPGHPYIYRVTAVDLRGNESPATADVKETSSQ